MISLFRRTRIIDTPLKAEKAIEKLYQLNNKYVSRVKFVEVVSKGTRTFGVSFYKNIAYQQLNYSVSKELWIENCESGSKLHVRTRPIVFIWAFPVIMLTMLPHWLYVHGLAGFIIYAAPILCLDILFLGKSIPENRKLDSLIDGIFS
ncbi:hypothetical protein [Shewanella denitrificans]|uniref:hypothetical protein n=1 Tax=Shewanella denitrificans TaxID=192073 RepID=UPI00059DB43E|nr:hypothetical protein [Shewanella denitrificans]